MRQRRMERNVFPGESVLAPVWPVRSNRQGGAVVLDRADPAEMRFELKGFLYLIERASPGFFIGKHGDIFRPKGNEVEFAHLETVLEESKLSPVEAHQGRGDTVHSHGMGPRAHHAAPLRLG